MSPERQNRISGPLPKKLVLEPFLQPRGKGFYNPITGAEVQPGDPEETHLRRLWKRVWKVDQIPDSLRRELFDDGWLVEDVGAALAKRFRLRVATLEASTVCNQACYFCPVSTDRRSPETMSMDFYEQIVRNLADFKDTLEGVFMINYNEPTVDPRFLDQVKMLGRYGLRAAVNTNGTGLKPSIVDAIEELGGLRYLSVNLSTLDRESYQRDRGRDHLGKVLDHLDYVSGKKIADQMDIAVLGTEDEEHRRQFAAISERFAGTHFTVRQFPVMDRGGWIEHGDRPPEPIRSLGGCENLGSRPVEHVHINPKGECILCCQDYGSDYVIGDLNTDDLQSILGGDRAAELRRQVYGIEEAPNDFLCRHCTFALCRPSSPAKEHQPAAKMNG